MAKKIIFFLYVLLAANVLFSKESRYTNIDSLGPRTEVIDLSVYNKIRYLSASSGSDEEGSGVKDKPWKTIQHGLNEIRDASGTNKYALFVAEGSYHQTPVRLKPYVDLYGGFSATDWQRDIRKHETILDADSKSRVLIGADNARIDGFIIRGGQVRGHGGGILCDDVSPVISNNIITSNHVDEPLEFNHSRIHQYGNNGGAIACLYNASPVIRNNLIVSNTTAIGNGAGIAVFGWLRMENAPPTEIQDNIMTGGWQAVIKDNLIINNIAGIADSSRTRSSNGGGISCAHEARPVIRNNAIIGNRAMGRSDAGGIYCEYYSYPEIAGNWIIGNTCDDDGGGIYTMRQSHPLIIKNIIAGNRTTGGGIGGIRISKEGRATILENEITFNPGGGVMSVDSYIELKNNTIVNNPNGYALVFKTSFAYMQPSIVKQNIISDNGEGAISVQKETEHMVVISENEINGGMGLTTQLSLSGLVQEVYFEDANFFSRIKTDLSLNNAAIFRGRVIRIKDRWGIINDIAGDDLIVWGDMRVNKKPEIQFHIIPTYQNYKW